MKLINKIQLALINTGKLIILFLIFDELVKNRELYQSKFLFFPQ